MPGSEGRRNERKPLIELIYEEKTKELVFPHRYYNELDDYKYVNISTKKGFVYWDIIVNQELERQEKKSNH